MQHNIYVFQFLVPWRIEKLNTSLAAFMIRLLYTQYDIILMDTCFAFMMISSHICDVSLSETRMMQMAKDLKPLTFQYVSNVMAISLLYLYNRHFHSTQMRLWLKISSAQKWVEYIRNYLCSTWGEKSQRLKGTKDCVVQSFLYISSYVQLREI